MSVAASAPGRTLGQISREDNIPLHKLVYVVQSRGIRPAYRLGRLRVFSDEQVGAIHRHLADMQTRRLIAD